MHTNIHTQIYTHNTHISFLFIVPYPGVGAGEVAAKVSKGTLTPSLPSWVALPFSSFVLKCFSREREDRPSFKVFFFLLIGFLLCVSSLFFALSFFPSIFHSSVFLSFFLSVCLCCLSLLSLTLSVCLSLSLEKHLMQPILAGRVCQ